MEFKIEKNVPLPVSSHHGITATLRKLKIGESFFIPEKKVINLSQRAHALNMTDKSNKKFASRSVDGGTRVWRIA